MSESILLSIAKNIGLPPEYDVFNPDLIMHINTSLSNLNQLGIGPAEGFMIEDEVPVWDDLLGGEPRLNNVKTLVYLQVRSVFDTASLTGAVITAMEKQIALLEYRINLFREEQLHDAIPR